MKSLRKRLAAAGLQPDYADIWGTSHAVGVKTLRAIGEALGEDIQTPAQPPVLVLRAGEASQHAWPVTGKIMLTQEDGTILPLKAKNELVALPALPAGYHRLSTKHGETVLLVAPPRCWLPERFAKGERCWGIAAQLYGVRSASNQGIGDFGDLTALVEQAAKLGAGVVGLNPLHALFPSQTDSFSPYAPSNRLFLNYLYIDVTQVEGYDSLKKCAEWTALRDGDLIDYPAVAAAKREALETLYARFAKKKPDASFTRFVEEGAEPLWRQAVFDALSEHFPECGWWGEWPKAYRDPASKKTHAFAEAQAERVIFYLWLQWLADRQLGRAAEAAKQGGMTLGLYRDLAVGSGMNGAEVWQDPEAYLRGVSVGAPPDEYNRKGQNWGLPPFNPVVLRKTGYAAFIALLRANMRYAGAIRIDHAFGLSRLWWVPDGMEASEGAYMSYPFDEMLAVLKIESHRQRCLVIGEDLGTFPPGYKETAAEAGVLSYRVLFFEREADGGFTSPSAYPAGALASISTHDLPTLAGWRAGHDIAVKEKLGLYPTAKMHRQDRDGRAKDVARLDEALAREGLDGEGFENAALYLASSPSMIAMLQLEDILGLTEQANLPATTTEHPNWRRRLPVPIETIFGKKSRLAVFASKLAETRSRRSPGRPESTYRLQFHAGFTFHDAAAILPYLAALGISHVYASPYTTARPGSTHGYDVFDHNRFNPELGGEEGYAVFRQALKESGLRQILDFVPNHMGVGEGNAWWFDVLRYGPDSDYAGFFDIDWKRHDGKLLLPVLGKPLEEAIRDGEITLKKQKGEWFAVYFDKRFPLDPRTEGLEKTPKPNAMTGIIAQQHWELGLWTRASTEINYRRFFDINDLAGLRMEDRAVFDAAHRLAFDLLAKEELSGLRIDHIDGLADPKQYLERLQEAAGPNLPVWVEKILEPGEAMRADWPVFGTSGYEVLNLINGVFVDPAQAEAFDRIYTAFSDWPKDLPTTVYEAKKQMLEISFGSELGTLSRLAAEALDEDAAALTPALVELLARFPIYRSYVADSVAPKDTALLADAAKRCDKNVRAAARRITAALVSPEGPLFAQRFQQLSGPLMAKGLEDTAFYRYFRFVSLNEVGGEPSHFGISVEQFHAENIKRAAHWPGNMIATATHDTKRGEDVRARLNALSAMPELWQERVTAWRDILRKKETPLSANDEYFIYQILLGSWPFELLETVTARSRNAYEERLKAYFQKALREAKLHTSWVKPDASYEKAAMDFLHRALRSKPFLDAFLPVARRIAQAGAVNGWAQLALKYTLPGIPDCYQGCEFWDLSLVDPDNRRPVDYAARRKALHGKASPAQLLKTWQDGRLKQRLMQALLQHRQAHPVLYAEGEYVPLAISGPKAGEALVYLRHHGDEAVLTLVPVHTGATEGWPVGEYWGKTAISLPDGFGQWRSVLNEAPLKGGASLSLSEVFAEHPFAILHGRRTRGQ